MTWMQLWARLWVALVGVMAIHAAILQVLTIRDWTGVDTVGVGVLLSMLVVGAVLIEGAGDR